MEDPLPRPRRGAKRPPPAQQQRIEEENESGCCECDAAGQLVCCDFCVRAFHAVCLPDDCQPGEQATSWACPVCRYFKQHEALEKLRGVWLQLQNPVPVPRVDPRRLRLKRREIADNATLTLSASSDDSEEEAPTAEFSHKRLFDVSHRRLLFQQQSPGSAPERRTASALPVGGKIGVGANHQVACLPLSFLALQQNGRSYDRGFESRVGAAAADKRVMYSLTDWRKKAQRLGTVAVPDTHSETVDAAGMVDEESLGKPDSFVDTEQKLAKFCAELASRWSDKSCWPYSQEYAFKILYRAGFDAKRALVMFDSEKFDFYGVCDPPVRPYFNKWRPSDKRSTFPATPFPPPSHLKAVLGPPGGTRTRQQTTFGNR